MSVGVLSFCVSFIFEEKALVFFLSKTNATKKKFFSKEHFKPGLLFHFPRLLIICLYMLGLIFGLVNLVHKK